MKRATLHNMLVAAYLSGVERAIQPFPSNIDAENEDQVLAHVSGSAQGYAAMVLSHPNVTILLED